LLCQLLSDPATGLQPGGGTAHCSVPGPHDGGNADTLSHVRCGDRQVHHASTSLPVSRWQSLLDLRGTSSRLRQLSPSASQLSIPPLASHRQRRNLPYRLQRGGTLEEEPGLCEALSLLQYPAPHHARYFGKDIPQGLLSFRPQLIVPDWRCQSAIDPAPPGTQCGAVGGRCGVHGRSTTRASRVRGASTVPAALPL